VNTSDPWPGPVGIIGAGAVGLALARALAASGVPLAGIGSRDPDHAAHVYAPLLAGNPWATATYSALFRAPREVVQQAQLIFLTVPDGMLGEVAADLPWRAEQWAVHCAGAQPAASIAAAVAPAQAGAFHPLAALPRPLPGQLIPADRFAGRVVALDGPDDVVGGLRALAERLGSVPLVVPPAARAGYHLAASLASNALVALVAQAVDVWTTVGLDPALALPALVPLIASTQANLAQLGLPAALTGPIARGDATTVARHLALLAADPALSAIAATYRLLGRRALALAREQGRIDPAKLDEIARLLDDP
jgi:predicted short-subunit dehydrogenase-like oxidoreductase (DUF2520 family)